MNLELPASRKAARRSNVPGLFDAGDAPLVVVEARRVELERRRRVDGGRPLGGGAALYDAFRYRPSACCRARVRR